jgi:hypothetical protein
MTMTFISLVLLTRRAISFYLTQRIFALSVLHICLGCCTSTRPRGIFVLFILHWLIPIRL